MLVKLVIEKQVSLSSSLLSVISFLCMKPPMYFFNFLHILASLVKIMFGSSLIKKEILRHTRTGQRALVLLARQRRMCCWTKRKSCVQNLHICISLLQLPKWEVKVITHVQISQESRSLPDCFFRQITRQGLMSAMKALISAIKSGGISCKVKATITSHHDMKRSYIYHQIAVYLFCIIMNIHQY